MSNYNSSSPIIANNIIVSNTATTVGGIWADGTSFPTIDYNHMWSNSPDDYIGCSPGTHDISQDPLFVAVSDFHLQSGSPCIDVGDDAAPSLPSTDFEGDLRILDGNGDSIAVVDMGVDEVLPPVVKIDTTTTTKLTVNKKPCLGKPAVITLGQSVQDIGMVKGGTRQRPHPQRVLSGSR